MIFRLQREIESLKTIIGVGKAKNTPLLDAHADDVTYTNSSMSVMNYPSYEAKFMQSQDGELEHEVSEVIGKEISSSMTLEDTEKETIRRSLERNGGRRKATARELNISERTLYRKIKEYDLE
jgi:transcriptional regulator with PAS, ATPase and Fis domain